MSVKIDGKELSKYIEYGISGMKERIYMGRGLEDEGKELERWLAGYNKGMVVRVEDHKFPEMMESELLRIDEIISEWKNNIFNFRIVFKTL